MAVSVPAETLEKLRVMPEVLNIFEDILSFHPKYKKIQNQVQKNNNGIHRISLNESRIIVGAETAWGLGMTGEGWYIAVLDTGILLSHEMFRGKHIIERCYSQGPYELSSDRGGCPNGSKEMSGPGSAAHDFNLSYIPGFDHGTNVAGVAAGNNGIDRFGVAKDANIIAVQVFSYIPEWDDVGAWSSDTLKGLEFVYSQRNNYRIASVNLSFGSGEYFDFCNSVYTEVINNLRSVGISCCISSGNEGYCGAILSPACTPGAIAVGGTDKRDNPYIFGNWDEEMVDLLAPAVDIITSGGETNSFYTHMSGTSYSAPHVAGAWALMKNYNENLSVDEILALLQTSGMMINTSCPNDDLKSRIDVGNALLSLIAIAPPTNFMVEQVSNRSLLQEEYINILTWERNTHNIGKNITHYNIYLEEEGQLNLLARVDSSVFIYQHRKAGKRIDRTYAISAVNDEGIESYKYSYTISF